MGSPASFPMNPDFADLLRALSARRARFLVVGAFAVTVHAEPRATGDIDLWVEPTPENAARVLAALRDFGAPLRNLSAEDLARRGTVFQMGVAPVRIDILTEIDGVTFESAWRSRVFARFGDVRTPVIGRAALIRNKLATGRPKDVLDVESLRRHARRWRDR